MVNGDVKYILCSEKPITIAIGSGFGIKVPLPEPSNNHKQGGACKSATSLAVKTLDIGCFISISILVETEFKEMAKEMKTRVKRRMKIEPFPWLRHYYIDIDNLYAKLTLKKIKNIIFDEYIEDIECKQMFGISSDDNGVKDTLERTKILLKGDAGMGKTVQGKRMACDDVFKVYPIEIVFFVALKFVQNGDAIENIIIQQNPQLGEMGVSERKLQALLERFGHRCLLILDGLDEHGLGQKEDITEIIKDKKLKNCGLVVSSRPHSVKEIENNFSTIVRVDGFSEQEARNFLSKMFEDKELIGDIMGFKPSGPREHFPIYKSPILLSVVSALIKGKKINLSDSSSSRGELYLQIVQCLYKKFTIRKGIDFDMVNLVKVMKRVGQLALLTSDNPILQKSDVLRIVGKSAFEYGFFDGHEDSRLFAHPVADIYICFIHTSVEEFFWSCGFLQALDNGKSVDDILGSDCKEPIFMVNPLVLNFCLWLLEKTFFQFPDTIYGKLALYTAKCIDSYHISVDEIEKMYAAISRCNALKNEDSLKLKFIKNVFEKMSKDSCPKIGCQPAQSLTPQLGIEDLNKDVNDI